MATIRFTSAVNSRASSGHTASCRGGSGIVLGVMSFDTMGRRT
jgi:hypothetical protein